MSTLYEAADLMRQRVRRRTDELVLVIIVVLVFIAIATQKIWELRVAAEEVAVLRTVGSIKSALGVHVAYTIMKGGAEQLVALDRGNPFQLLKEPLPPNFEVLTEPTPAEDLKPFRWYFDSTSGVLIYRVGNEDRLETSLPGPPCLRFQLRLRFDDHNSNGRFDRGTDVVAAMELVTLEPYRWRNSVGG